MIYIGEEPFCRISRIEDIEYGNILPCITKILERDHYKVTFLYNTYEVRCFDFTRWFDDFKDIEMYKPFFVEENFATMYVDKKALAVVIPAIQTGECEYTDIYDEKYLKSKGYKPYDGIHFGDYFMFSGDSIYEESDFVCFYDQWCEHKYRENGYTKITTKDKRTPKTKERLNLIKLIQETENNSIRNNEMLSPKEIELATQLLPNLKNIVSNFALAASEILEMPFVDKMMVLSTEDLYNKLKALPKEYGENVVKKIYSENNDIYSYDDIHNAIYHTGNYKKLEHLKQQLSKEGRRAFDESVCKSRLYIELCLMLFPEICDEIENNLIRQIATIYQIVNRINNSQATILSKDELYAYDTMSRLLGMLFKITDDTIETNQLFDFIENEYIPLIQNIDCEIIESSLLNSISKFDRLPMPKGFDIEKITRLGQELKRKGYLDVSVNENNFAKLFDSSNEGKIEEMYWLKDAGEFTILLDLLYNLSYPEKS